MPVPIWRHWFRSLRQIAGGAPPRGRSRPGRLGGVGPALDELERRVVPARPSVVSITRAVPAGPNTDASSVSFTVTFSEAVTGVDPTDFTAPTTGTVTAAVTGVTQVSGAVYTVAVGGISGAGTVGLDLTDNGTIHDLAGDRLVSGGPATFAAPTTVPAVGLDIQSYTPVVADVNGDGKPDIVFTNLRTVEVALGNGDGTFQLATAYPTGGPDSPAAIALAVADVNGDGKPDLVAVNENSSGPSTVGVLLGNGDGTFRLASTLAASEWATGVAVADLNKDGKPDLVVTNWVSNSVSVFLGNGDGTFQPPSSLPDPLAPSSVVVADVNGDGKPDLVSGNLSTGVSIFPGNGDGTFQPQQVVDTGSGTQTEPTAVAFTDVNADGKPDLVVADFSNACAYVLLGNGNGAFHPAGTFPTGGTPAAVAVADLNGDDRPDIVTANMYSDTVSILPGNGDGTFRSQQTLIAGTLPDGVAVADLSGDGRPDLVVVNMEDANRVEVYQNTTTGSFAGQTYTIGTGTTTAVATSTNASVYGQPVTFTATVSGGGTPAGSVEFFDDTTGADLGAGTLQGTTGTTATWAYSTRPTQLGVVGVSFAHTIRAVYTPTGAFAASSGALTDAVAITPAPVTVSGITVGDKVYDGTTTATLNTTRAKLVGVFPGDEVGISTAAAAGLFQIPDVGTGIPVYIGGLVLAGSQAPDYSISTLPTTTASITPAPVTVSGVTAANKVYDGTTAATLNTTGAALSGVVTGDDVTLVTAGAVGTFASKATGTGITVTVSGLTLVGTAAGDYALIPPTTTANITPPSPPPPTVPPAVPPTVPPTVSPVALVGAPVYAVGADAGGPPTVTVYNPDGSVAATLNPFPGTTGGVRTAAADFAGSGAADVAAGTPAPGPWPRSRSSTRRPGRCSSTSSRSPTSPAGCSWPPRTSPGTGRPT